MQQLPGASEEKQKFYVDETPLAVSSTKCETAEMSFVVRAPREDEADRLAALHVASWRETYEHLLPAGFFTAEHSAKRQQMWRNMLGNPRESWVIRLAEVDGRTIGFAMSGPTAPTADHSIPRERQLFMLYVLREFHGSGAGQALLDAVLGTAPAVLWVAAENPRAVAFYRRNGFEFDGVVQTDPTAPAITDARMVR